MPGDVAEILGWLLLEDEDGESVLSKEQYETAQRLHFEMGYVAKSLLGAFAVSV